MICLTDVHRCHHAVGAVDSKVPHISQLVNDPGKQPKQQWNSIVVTGLPDVQKFLGSRWPDELGSEWAHTCLDFQAKTHKVALMVLEALAIALQLDVEPFLEVCRTAVYAAALHSRDVTFVVRSRGPQAL